MATKKNIHQEIIQIYTDLKLNGGGTPTVYQICKIINIEESEFYNHFNSVNAIENKILLEIIESSLEVLQKSKEYSTYSQKDKLLSFYFTFFETLTLNRSMVLSIINSQPTKWEKIKALSVLKEPYINFFESLQIAIPKIKIDKILSAQEKGVEYAAWSQLLITIKFWMDDTSLGFEKTDIFIEKSIKNTFNFIEYNTLNDLLDFGKFIWKEKFYTFS